MKKKDNIVTWTKPIDTSGWKINHKHDVPILGYCADEEAPDEGPCSFCNKWCIFLDGQWRTEEEIYGKKDK